MYRKKQIIRAAAAVLCGMLLATPLAAQAATPTASNFDYLRYAEDYPDLKAAFGTNAGMLWSHYQAYGMREGRVAYTTDGTRALPETPAAEQTQAYLTSATFDSARYANDYRDLRCAFGYDHDALWRHYLTYGKREGRIVYNRAGQKAVAEDSALLPAGPTREQQFANTMIGLVNAERARHGAPALALADDCMAAAAVRGQDFIHYLNSGAAVTALPHIRPDGSLFTTAYTCCRGSRYGENTWFAYFFTDDDIASFAQRTHASMREHSDEFMRMINPDYRYAGFTLVKLADVGQSTWYVVLEEFRN